MSPSLRALGMQALLAAAVVAHAAPGADKKRREPVDVPPVVVDGVRYEAPRLGTPFGFDQDGGFVTARRADSGALVWTRRVYEMPHDPSMEDDKQDVFIKQLALTADGQRLLVVNERGQRFEIGLDGGGLRTGR